MPRARLTTPEGGTAEWKSEALRAYQRRTLAADALIASSYLAGTNTRRVRRALAALFGGTIGKDTVSRTWRKVKGDWDAWNSGSLAAEPIVRLILDGTSFGCASTARRPRFRCSLCLACERTARRFCSRSRAWAARAPRHGARCWTISSSAGCRRPECVIVDGAPGLDKAIAAVWDGVPVQRCTVHKHRNLLAHAPERLHEEITCG